MKTTVDISDPLLTEAKKVARRERLTLRELIEEGLRRSLADHRQRRRSRKFKLRDGSIAGAGLRPGIDEGDWEVIRALIYEKRGG